MLERIAYDPDDFEKRLTTACVRASVFVGRGTSLSSDLRVFCAWDHTAIEIQAGGSSTEKHPKVDTALIVTETISQHDSVSTVTDMWSDPNHTMMMNGAVY
jgi:hypothetical protein